VLGLVGLWLLRPGRGLTAGGAITGLLLLLIPAGGYYGADAVDEAFYDAARSTYAHGARPLDTITRLCDGTQWTWPDTPTTWTMVCLRRSGSPSCSVAAYRGWKRAWMRHLDPGTSYNELAGYSRLYLVTQGSDAGAGYSKLRLVVALDRKTGRTKWTYTCNCTANVEYHGVDGSGESPPPVRGTTRYVRVVRSDVSREVVLDPATGRRIADHKTG
jgi:hypothetical protein